VTQLADGADCEQIELLPTLLRAEGLEPVVRLCIGTRVLLTRNIDPDRGLVNGTLGVVVDFTESGGGDPMVRWDSGIGIQESVQPDSFTSTVSNITAEVEIQAKGGPRTLRISYMPLLCAWAITVHRAQGMTLAMARIYARTIKAPALMYTALSRVKTLAGLEIEGEVKEENIIARPEAVRFYTRLTELVDAQENGLAVVPTSMILEEGDE
jgi:ATP-dependent DNA helicase PIF1